MTRSKEETRRAFLLKLARTAAFVPPLVATLDVRNAAAQGGGGGGGGPGGGGTTTGGGGGGGGKPNAATTVGSLSPTAQVTASPTLDLQTTQQNTAAPWSPDAPSQPPPWSRPPPTQTGR